MLAILGFSIGGVILIIYGVTFNQLVVEKLSGKIREYSYAHMMLGVAFLVWALAVIINDPQILKFSVLFGNLMIFVGSALMANVFFDKKLNIVAPVSVIVSLLIIYLRYMFFTPDPYLENGVLIFNTDAVVSIFLSILFLAIWLPANIKVAKEIVALLKAPEMLIFYTSLYTFATLSAVLFTGARRVLVVVGTFTVLCVCFLLLTATNIITKKQGV